MAAQAAPIDIIVTATVPNVAMVDSLDYDLDIDEVTCPPPGGNDIPGYSTVGLLLISAISLLGLAAMIKKKQH